MTSDIGVSTGVSAAFAVRGLTCGSCAARVQRTLGKQPGVASAEVNYATATAQVVLTEQPGSAAAGEGLIAGLVRAVAKTGYQLVVRDDGQAELEQGEPAHV
ncbi:MAG: heavy-metal-associated domain-containing protein [Actinomycetota bacterium]|nr:heavy-metal-associated domain-containing protein [Actinomycetota bacterium]